MKITWFGHSAYRLDFADAVVLIDPFLSGNPTYEGSVEEAAAGCTHLVLTHGHDDHLGDCAEIVKTYNPQLIASFEICMWLVEQGAQNINPGNTGGTVRCGPFSLSFTPALHSSGITRDGKSIYLGNPLGIVIKADGEPTLYHMGDTDIFGDMALVEELHQPSIGIVPIGDRFTMGAAAAALACRRYFNFSKVLPCHWGTFELLDASPNGFLAEMGDRAHTVFVPTIGKGFDT